MFKISNDAIEHIKRTGEDVLVYVKTVTAGGGWCAKQAFSLVPAVRAGKPHPEVMKHFSLYPVEGINVWKEKEILFENQDTPASIELKKVFFMKVLTIDGVRAAQVDKG